MNVCSYETLSTLIDAGTILIKTLLIMTFLKTLINVTSRICFY
jgi:hypothetical protein